MSSEELKSVAAEMSSGTMTPELRARFIAVRAALFTRGIYDPVLVRFDSATVPQVSAAEAGEALMKWGD